jgi:hypothetical protein
LRTSCAAAQQTPTPQLNLKKTAARRTGAALMVLFIPWAAVFYELLTLTRHKKTVSTVAAAETAGPKPNISYTRRLTHEQYDVKRPCQHA